MTDAQPQVLSTTTAATPSDTPLADALAASLPTGEVPVQEAPAPEDLPADPTVSTVDTEHVDVESPANYSPNFDAINRANGDPHIWAHEFYELIGHTTGKWIDEESLEEWLKGYGGQVQQAVYRTIVFEIANSAVPARVAGDAAYTLLQFRDEIARGYRQAAGLA